MSNPNPNQAQPNSSGNNQNTVSPQNTPQQMPNFPFQNFGGLNMGNQNFQRPGMPMGFLQMNNANNQNGAQSEQQRREYLQRALMNGQLQANNQQKEQQKNMMEEQSNEVKKQIDMLFEIAQASASKGDYQHAINVYQKILNMNEKSYGALIAIGHCYAMQDENYKALASYQQALNVAPDSQKDDQLWYGIGLLYQKIEDWKNAETSFKNSLKLKPSGTLKAEILYNLGNIKRTQGEHKESTKLLTQAVMMGSFGVEKMINTLCKVGMSLEEVGDFKEANKTYDYALMLDENNMKALQCAGWLCFQQNNPQKGLEHLQKAHSINEDDCNVIYMMSRCLLKLKKHQEAYEYLHKCISKDQTNYIYWTSLGILFSELMQLKQSHESLTNALKFGPKVPENYFNMGCLFELSNQPNDAVMMYDKAIEVCPSFHLAHTRKLGIYSQMENKQASSDVQFKHHKFQLTFKDDEKETKQMIIAPETFQTSLNTLQANLINNQNQNQLTRHISAANPITLQSQAAAASKDDSKPSDSTANFIMRTMSQDNKQSNDQQNSKIFFGNQRQPFLLQQIPNKDGNSTMKIQQLQYQIAAMQNANNQKNQQQSPSQSNNTNNNTQQNGLYKMNQNFAVPQNFQNLLQQQLQQQQQQNQTGQSPFMNPNQFNGITFLQQNQTNMMLINNNSNGNNSGPQTPQNQAQKQVAGTPNSEQSVQRNQSNSGMNAFAKDNNSAFIQVPSALKPMNQMLQGYAKQAINDKGAHQPDRNEDEETAGMNPQKKVKIVGDVKPQVGMMVQQNQGTPSNGN